MRGASRMFVAALLLAALADVHAGTPQGRHLLAHKPSGGTNLHGVVLTGAGFSTTNGNGSWTSLLSGVGGTLNSAFSAANSNPGAQGSGATTVFNFNIYGPAYQGVTSVTFPSRSLGIAVGLGPGGTATVDQAPSILITLDAALTWLAVTGFSGPLPTAAAHVAPDLISVACATRNLCWTVGGYYPTKSSAQTSWQLSSTAGILPTTGMLAISTNGGTMWSWATLPTGTGALAAVAADGTGKSVYAVGHPFWATTGASHVASAAVASPFGPYAPTILMSNSYGVNGTWALQVAPVLPGATYSLTGLAVLRGSAAFASGGNPWGYTNLGQAGSVTLPTATGVIIGTQNGGFSWTVQTLPSFGGIPNYVAPAINVALTNLAPQPATVWTSQANNTLPAVNGVAAITASSQYTVWGVGDHGYVVTATVPASSLHSSAGVSPSQSWTVSSAAVLASGYADLNGITWDNNKVGYIWGGGVILSSHDGGATWQSESPAAVVTGGLYLESIAIVPTSY